MIEELRTSTELLKVALDRYLDACSVIANYFEAGSAIASSTISQVVTNELQSILSYETAITQAKVTISRMRNSCTTVVPINTLPPEILTRIFQLATHSQHCQYNYKEGEDPRARLSIKRPEILSHVCSRWYQIAAGFNDLWKHIGLVPFHSHDKLLARGDVFVARAGLLPLEIHIVGGDPKRLQEPDDKLSSFCASVAPRLSSLDLIAREEVMRAHLSILEACFLNCVPGTLKQLTLKGHFSGSSSSYSFISAEIPSGFRTQVLNVPNQRFEDLLLHAKVLNLRGVFLPWDSQAYHGLEKLTIRTHFTLSSAFITKSQLMRILVASPMLREFKFGVRITELGQDNPSQSIVLNELQDISLDLTDDSQRKALLRMLSPGLKPLRMAMEFYKEVFPSQPDEELDMFLARANVTELRIKSRTNGTTFPDLLRLLRVAPSLRDLTLHGYQLNSHTDTDGDEHPLAGLRLNSLNLFNCKVDLTQLQRIAKILPIRILRFAEECWFIVQGSPLKPDMCQSELSEIFPVVKSIVGKGFGDVFSPDD